MSPGSTISPSPHVYRLQASFLHVVRCVRQFVCLFLKKCVCFVHSQVKGVSCALGLSGLEQGASHHHPSHCHLSGTATRSRYRYSGSALSHTQVHHNHYANTQQRQAHHNHYYTHTHRSVIITTPLGRLFDVLAMAVDLNVACYTFITQNIGMSRTFTLVV